MHTYGNIDDRYMLHVIINIHGGTNIDGGIDIHGGIDVDGGNIKLATDI